MWISTVLLFCAQHGRWFLVIGIVAGVLLPQGAQAMRPWLPGMVACLLSLSAMRVGYQAAVGGPTSWVQPLVEVGALQFGLPALVCIALLLLDVGSTTVVLAVALMLAAPSVTGGPSFLAIMGRDPAPAMQLLVVGTALFPLSALLVLTLLLEHTVIPDFSVMDAAKMAILLFVLLFALVAAGFFARVLLLPNPRQDQLQQLDGLNVLALAIIVVGLMAGLEALIRSDQLELLGWLGLVCALNFGLQLVTFHAVRPILRPDRRAAVSVVAGNRNVALFLLLLPAETVDLLLPFLACYQIPMYLTPVVMARLYKEPDP